MNTRLLVTFVAIAVPSPARADNVAYEVNPDAGNNKFTATFDAPLGERITAVSSNVGCQLQVDSGAKTASASCDLPLTSINVDGNDTKTHHFYEWATNKKSEPKDCRVTMRLQSIKPEKALAPNERVKFTGQGVFTICGRGRDGGGAEAIEGEAVLLPAGSYGPAETIRIHAKIARFNRESYGVSPKNTSGWLSRVQQLAPVVAAEGEVEVNLFAKRK